MIWCCAFAVLCVAVYDAAKAETNEWMVVNMTQGPVRGRRESDGVYAFYSIPYATAPTGKNKFKAPRPPPTWTKTLHATDKEVICPQANHENGVLKTKTMREDCLRVNVFVPKTENKKLPVVVYIHSGAFQVGYGNRQKAKALMSDVMIVVTFNYRLGVHGFLCLGTRAAPGNAGMKDMVALLKWVKKNIASFGGDPNNVAISGYSAGAAAADLLILSKSSKGLFNKVIVESGASLAEYAVQTDPLETAKTHARSLNFANVDDINALEDFYKNASFDLLNAYDLRTTSESFFVFTPCVEHDASGDVFLHDSPIRILQSGDYIKVPMLYGFTDMEGLIRVPLFEYWQPAMSEKFSDFIPSDLMFDNNKEKERIADKIKEFYFGRKPIDMTTIRSYVDFFTDITFASPALRSVSLNVKGGNMQIYLYLYAFVEEGDLHAFSLNIHGADHSAQSKAIFDDVETINVSTKYNKTRQIVRNLWREFITTGKPSSSWLPTSASRTPYMLFSKLGEVVKHDILLEKRGQFWDDIYEKYYRAPIPPPKALTVPKAHLFFANQNYKNKNISDVTNMYVRRFKKMILV